MLRQRLVQNLERSPILPKLHLEVLLGVFVPPTEAADLERSIAKRSLEFFSSRPKN